MKREMLNPIMRKMLFAIAVLFCCSASQAGVVQYGFGVDDFVQFYIDGNLKASYDEYPAGAVHTDYLNLSNGWHDIQIIYKNRWISNYLELDEISNTGIWNPVPIESLRSLDSQGNLIQGLRAEYFTLEGDYVTTIYGEGPIYHGWTPQGSRYQGVNPSLWAGIYDGFSLFEERLSGQIFVIPEPSTLLLLGLGAMLLRRKI